MKRTQEISPIYRSCTIERFPVFSTDFGINGENFTDFDFSVVVKTESENFNVIHSKLEYKDAIFAVVQKGDAFLEKSFYVIDDFFLRRHRYCQNYCTSITFCEALVYSFEQSLSTLHCFLLTTKENLKPFVFSSRKSSKYS